MPRYFRRGKRVPGATVNVGNFATMSYNELRSIAKLKGIKATGTKGEILKRLQG